MKIFQVFKNKNEAQCFLQYYIEKKTEDVSHAAIFECKDFQIRHFICFQ